MRHVKSEKIFMYSKLKFENVQCVQIMSINTEMFDFCKQTKKIANEWYIHTWSKLMMESEGKFSMVQSWSYLCVIFQSILLDWTWIFFCWQLEIKIYGKHISWGLHVHVFEELIAKLKYHIFHWILYVFIDK